MSAPSDAKQRFGNETNVMAASPRTTITLPRGDKIVVGADIQDDSIKRSILAIHESIPETRRRLWKALVSILNMETDEAARIRIRLERLPKCANGKVTVDYLIRNLEPQIGPLSVTKSEDDKYYDVYLHLCKIWVERSLTPPSIYIGRIECNRYPSDLFMRHF